MKTKLIFCFILFCGVINAQTSNWVWAKQAIGKTSYGFDVAMDGSGNTYVGGAFNDTAQFDNITVIGPDQWANVGYVTKYDSIGTIQWVDKFTSNESSSVDKISIDSQNNILVLGYFSGTLHAGGFILNSTSWNNVLFLLKISPLGNVLWAKQANSTMTCQAVSISIDALDNIYLTGDNSAQASFDNLTTTTTGMFIVKYNSAGTPTQLIQQPKCSSRSVNVGKGSKIYFSGTLGDTAVIGNDTLYPTGYYQAVFNGNSWDTVFTFSNDMLFICYDASGNVVWWKQAKSKSYDNWTFSALDDFSNLYVTSYTNDTTDFWGTSLFPTSLNTPFMIKIDSLGKMAWLKSGQSISTNGRIYFQNITCRNNYIYTVGFPAGISSFANVTVNSGSSNQNSFILKMDSAGNGIWVQIDTTNLERLGSEAISVDKDENITICGIFQKSAHFGNHYLNSYGKGSLIMFAAKMSSHPLGVNENVFLKDRIDIFPNPSNGHFCVLNEKNKIDLMQVHNIFGEKVYSSQINSNKTEIDLSSQPNGIYFLQLRNNNGVVSKKVIIQK